MDRNRLAGSKLGKQRAQFQGQLGWPHALLAADTGPPASFARLVAMSNAWGGIWGAMGDHRPKMEHIVYSVEITRWSTRWSQNNFWPILFTAAGCCSTCSLCFRPQQRAWVSNCLLLVFKYQPSAGVVSTCFCFIIETWVRMIGTCVPVKEAAFLGQLAVRFNFLWQLKWTTARLWKLYCLSFFQGACDMQEIIADG